MLRVKDAEVSLKYYQEVLGMTLLRTSENKEAGFNLYFLGYPASNPQVQEGARNPVAEWEGLLELTWNYGTEKQEGKVYHDGNSEPQGFGHICKSLNPDFLSILRSNKVRYFRGRLERRLRAIRVTECQLEEASD
jgi:lactoylglutathione lyase